MTPTDYERKAARELRRWQGQAPPGARAGRGESRALRLLQSAAPMAAVRAALTACNHAARRLADQDSVLARAKLREPAQLREAELETCDALARHVVRRGEWLAAAGGAALGIAGAPGLAADIPALLTVAMRTVHRVGACYGESPAARDAPARAMAVFALAAAQSLDEKQALLALLRADSLEESGDAHGHTAFHRLAERQLAKDAASYSLKSFARGLVTQLGRRRLIGALPVLGAAVGAAANANYVHELGLTARAVFRERWLLARYGELPA